MDDTTTKLFISLVIFWTLLTMFSYAFSDKLQNIQIIKDGNTISETVIDQRSFFSKVVDNITDTLTDIPIIEYIVPLLKILTFQYAEQIPALMVLFLNMIGIFTAYIGLQLIKN